MDDTSDRGMTLDGVRVTAEGGFDLQTWTSTGIRYHVELSTDADAKAIEALLAAVDEVAEIPRALRAGMPVRRVAASDSPARRPKCSRASGSNTGSARATSTTQP